MTMRVAVHFDHTDWNKLQEEVKAIEKQLLQASPTNRPSARVAG